MTKQDRIDNAMGWAESMRKVRGSVSSTYIDGDIKAVATPEGVKVYVDGMEVSGGDQVKLSLQQLDVINWVRTGDGSCNVIARAGTGKTTLLMEVAKTIPPTSSGFMGAFNKSIADEFKARLMAQGSRNVTGATLHSAGNAACRRANPAAGRDYVDSRKVNGIMKDKFGWDRELLKALYTTISFGKQAVFGVKSDYKDPQNWKDTIDEFELGDDIPKALHIDKFIEYCIEGYEKSLALCDRVIDFDDMLLAPLYFKWSLPKYDWVMLDEAQDTNMARRLISFAMMHESTRFIAVGDDRQAIYRFAGANSDAMSIIRDALGSIELPLTVTYRCPKTVVDLAQVWVPDFTAHENAPEGETSTIGHRMFWEENLRPDDVVLCRNTRPLMGIAGRLRDAGIPCIVEGVSAKGLLSLTNKWGEELPLEEFHFHLDEWESKEVAKWLAKDSQSKVEWTRDRCDTLRDIARNLGVHATTRTLSSRISMMFGQEPGNRVLTLCTVHRSKGREWNRVYLIGRNRYMPSHYAESEEDMTQEENLMYVAVTRSKDQLIEVTVPLKEKGETPWWEL